MQRAVSALVAFLVLVGPTRGQSIVDGDTLRLNGTTFRLWGMDAPESQQICADGWRAGRASTSFLRNLAHDKTITCEVRTTDRYRRTVAICPANGVDLGASMVAAGMALAFVRYSSAYLGEEDICACRYSWGART